MIYHLTRDELGALPVGAAVMLRGKELAHDATVDDARRLFRSPEILVIPVLDGPHYVGAVDRSSIPDGASGSEPLSPLVGAGVPVARASTTTAVALEQLDRQGGQRLVVVEDDGSTYHGLVCLRSDRVRLCVGAAGLEHHLDAVPHRTRKEHP